MPQPRILVACDYFWPSVGGLEVVAERLGEELLKRGYGVDIATGALRARIASVYRGMRILSLDTSRSFLSRVPRSVRKLRHLIVKGGYSACILLADPLNWVIWSLEGAPIPDRTRVLVQPLINEDGFSRWKGDERFRARLSAILKRADAVIALTRGGTERRYLGEEGIPAVYLPNATEPGDAAPGFRARFGVVEESPLLLNVANLWPVKNQVGLLRTLNGMSGEWRLVLIGHPSGDAGYVARVREGVEADPRVTLIPGLPPAEVASAMKAADAVLLASHGEVSPLTILEAMSHGKPWLATPECGAVNDYAGGLVAPLADFPMALDLLLNHARLRDALGDAGRRHWQACYTWKAVADGWDDLIRTGEVDTSRFAMPSSVAVRMRKIRESVPDRFRQSVAPGR